MLARTRRRPSNARPAENNVEQQFASGREMAEKPVHVDGDGLGEMNTRAGNPLLPWRPAGADDGDETEQ